MRPRITIVGKRFCLDADARDDFIVDTQIPYRDFYIPPFVPESFFVNCHSGARWITGKRPHHFSTASS